MQLGDLLLALNVRFVVLKDAILRNPFVPILIPASVMNKVLDLLVLHDHTFEQFGLVD